MAGTVAERRRALKDRLIVIAERRIAEEGPDKLRARDLAAEAGCAVGAIYTVFEDLNDLVLAVNARTSTRIGAAVAEAVAANPDPWQQLAAIAVAYHRFAAENTHAWRALFDIRRDRRAAPPDWYLSDMDRLLAVIEAALVELLPGMEAGGRRLLARAVFSSIHGIVSLGLDETSAGVPAREIDRMIEMVLSRVALPSY